MRVSQRAYFPSGKKNNERKKETARFKVACLNTRTIQDSEGRPQRRSALVARELARLDIDIAARSEVRFAGQGSFTEDGAGYTHSLPGKNKDMRRLSCVGFMIKTSIARKLQILPVGHSDHLMSLRLPIRDSKFATVLSVYAPTLQAVTGVKEVFYRDLHNLLQQADSKDKRFILGDFNTRVGRDFETWKGVHGRHGTGNCSDDGRLLLEVCFEHQLTVTNTLFQQKSSFKET